jgi:hypothetical protein
MQAAGAAAQHWRAAAADAAAAQPQHSMCIPCKFNMLQRPFLPAFLPACCCFHNRVWLPWWHPTPPASEPLLPDFCLLLLISVGCSDTHLMHPYPVPIHRAATCSCLQSLLPSHRNVMCPCRSAGTSCVVASTHQPTRTHQTAPCAAPLAHSAFASTSGTGSATMVERQGPSLVRGPPPGLALRLDLADVSR